MAVSRYYASTAQPTTLTGSISAGATSVGVNSPTGFPVAYPFTAAIDYGTATEELVDVTAASGGTWTVTRGVDGTSAQSHSIGAPVRHVSSARDFADSRTHEAATAAVHGVTGTLVGTSDTQTLVNKTLTAPAVSAPVITGGGSLAGTFTGTPTLSGAVVLSGTPSITAGAALSGTVTGSPTLSGNPAFSGSPTFTGNPMFNTAAGVLSQRALGASSAWRTAVTGDSVDRYYVTADGTQHWGPGNAAVDTTLARVGAGNLQTDTDITIGRNLSVTGTADISGALSAGNVTLGAWSSWQPVWTTATGAHTPSYGNATVTGTYAKLGRLLVFSLGVTFGSSTNFGASANTNDNWLFSLPIGCTASGTFTSSQAPCGYGRASQSASLTAPVVIGVDSGGNNFTVSSSGGRQDAVALVNPGGVDSLSPWTWASGGTLQFFGMVETTS